MLLCAALCTTWGKFLLLLLLQFRETSSRLVPGSSYACTCSTILRFATTVRYCFALNPVAMCPADLLPLHACALPSTDRPKHTCRGSGLVFRLLGPVALSHRRLSHDLEARKRSCYRLATDPRYVSQLLTIQLLPRYQTSGCIQELMPSYSAQCMIVLQKFLSIVSLMVGEQSNCGLRSHTISANVL
jgi:hypothetical protein